MRPMNDQMETGCADEGQVEMALDPVLSLYRSATFN